MSGSVRSLLAASQKVFDLNPFRHLPDMVGLQGSYFSYPLWLHPNVILFQTTCPNGSFADAYQLEFGKRYPTLCRRFSARLNIREFRGAWSLSPDRNWVLWREGWLLPDYQFTATRVDGTKSVRWTVNREKSEGPFLWLPHSHRWMHLLHDVNKGAVVGAQFYDLDHPYASNKVKFPALQTPNWLGEGSDGTIFLSDWDDFGKRNLITITTLAFPQRQLVLRTFKVNCPDQGTVSALCPSPDGKHLAWLIDQGSVVQKGDEYSSPQQTMLYISTIDGRQVRAVGTIAFTRRMDDVNTTLHGWFPHNRALLLEFRDQLFSVPV